MKNRMAIAGMRTVGVLAALRSGGALAALAAVLAVGLNAPAAQAQGTRKDDIVFNAQGRPMAGASVRVCTSMATGQPCTPLALIYSDPGLTQALANPITTDGLGNYTFYAAPGRYEIEISGPSITTKQLPNVVLPSDPSTPTFTTVTTTSGISAFSLTLSGNLSVSGSASVAGTLTVGGAPVPSTTADNQWTTSQRFKGPTPWRDFSAYMPAGGCSSNAADLGANTTGTINGGSTTLTVVSASDFKNGCGIAVLHAGPASTLNSPASSIAVTSASRAGSMIVTIASSGGHGLAVGTGSGYTQGVVVSGCSNTSYNGTFPIQSIPDATHFTYQAATSGTDSATGCTVAATFGYAHGATGSTTYHYKIAAVDQDMGYSAASAAAVTITNGNASLNRYNYNHLMWPYVNGAYEYIIYSDLGLGGGYSCVGTAFANAYSDRGLGMPCPVFAPATVPASAGQQTLNTKIVSGGGTTTLTLANAATVTAASQNVYHDESGFLTACVNDVIAYQAPPPLNNQANEYGCLIPAGTWWFNGMLPSGSVSAQGQTVRIRVEGKTIFQTFPWFLEQSGYYVEGVGGGPGPTSFGHKAQVGMFVGSTVAAGAVIKANAIEFSGFELQGVQGTGIYVVNGAGISINNDAVSSAGAGPALALDFSTIGFYASDDEFGGGPTNSGMPAILFSSTPFASGGSPSVAYFNNLFTYNHSVEFSNPGGNQAGNAANGIYFSNWLSEGLAPVDIGIITIDDGPNAPGTFLNYAPVTELSLINMNNADTSATAEFVASGASLHLTGVTLINTGIGSGAVPAIACINNAPACGQELTINAYFAANGPSVPGLMSDQSTGGWEIGAQGQTENISRGPLLLEDTQPGRNPATIGWAQVLPQLSGFAVTGTSTGTLGAGVWCAQVAGVDARGQETLPTPPVCQTVAVNSSISYSWLQGPLGTAYSSFTFYYCTVSSGVCSPNTKLTSVAPAGFDPVTYTFSSTSGGIGGVPNQTSQAYLSWLGWDANTTPYSCFYCASTVRNQSDLWPIGLGVIPTSNVGVNLFAAKAMKVGTGTFSTLSACTSGLEGAFRAVSDSTTNTWGATITGSGTNHVLAYCDGTNWTVAGK